MKTIPRAITITPALNGYVCRVGCQTLVFEGRDTMISALKLYLEDPYGMESEYRDHAIHKELIGPGIAPEFPPPPQCDCGIGGIATHDCGTISEHVKKAEDSVLRRNVR